MPTIAQIIAYADRKCSNSESISNKVSDLNDLHTEIYVKIAKLKNEYKTFEAVTVADQLKYTLPTDCSIDNIIAVKVSQSASGWDTYDYAGVNDDTTVGTFYGDAGNNEIAILKDDSPIPTDGLFISIFYYKRPTELTSSNTAVVPDLHPDYHNLLKYGLIQSLASQGHSADTGTADYWQAKYDEFMKDVEASLSERYNKAPSQSNQAESWW